MKTIRIDAKDFNKKATILKGKKIEKVTIYPGVCNIYEVSESRSNKSSSKSGKSGKKGKKGK